MFRAAPSLCAALLALLMPCLAPAAGAAEVQQVLTGKVQELKNVDQVDPSVVAALAAHGVVVGADATLTLILDDSVLGEPASVPEFTQYIAAIVEMRFSIGTYEAWLAPPKGYEATTIVTVANDIAYGPYLTDAYNALCLGYDTDGILATVGDLSETVSLSLSASRVVAAPGGDEGIVQPVATYDQVFGSVSHHLDIIINFSPTPGSTGTPGLARQGQLKAAAKLGKSVLGGLGKLAKAAPETDPFGTKKDELLEGATETFGEQFIAAVVKAVKKGGSAPLDASQAGEATDYLMDAMLPLAEEITAGVDTANPKDRALRGKLLQAAATKLRAELLAYAAHAKKPNAEKLGKALDKAEAALAKSVEKALAKAEAQGVVYAGPEANVIDGTLGKLAGGFDLLTQDG